MSAVATGPVIRNTRLGAGVTRPRRRQPAPPMAFDALFDRPADEPTLDDLVVGAWEDLSAHRTVTCPVCGSAAMRPRYGAGLGVAGGRCGDCGSVLG